MSDFQKLDDAGYVTRLDPKGMYALTAGFPDQVAQAVAAAQAVEFPSLAPKLVVVTGLGGSAAGGDFLRALFEAYSTVPYQVNRDYSLPAYVNADTLVLACSYSGNTEETLAAYEDATRKGAKIIVVTSGGKLADWANRDGHPLVLIPAGQPPRTALGYLLMPTIVACEKLGLIPAQDYAALVRHLEGSVRQWSVEVPLAENPTKQLATKLYGKLGNLYGLGSWQGLVAYRWKGQICENAKNMVFAHTFPELNHNEILGWVLADQQGVSHWVTVILEDGTESAKMKKRAEVTSRLIGGVSSVERVKASGGSLLEKMLSLALHGDFVSLYLAALNGVDPENIDSINILKSELASIP